MSGDEVKIKQPQINWYREYVLEPNANVALSFDEPTAKQVFEDSLFKKVWGATLGEGEHYPNQENNEVGAEHPYYTFKYGINAAGVGCEKSMMFGITFRHARKAPTTAGGNYGVYEITSGYLFIVAAYTEEVTTGEGESATTETVQKVRVRSHQLVVIPNTEFADDSKTVEKTDPDTTVTTKTVTTISGIRITNGDIVIGIKKEEVTVGENTPTTSVDFYFPLKSFFLEGRHQEPVQFIEGYEGKFAITLL